MKQVIHDFFACHAKLCIFPLRGLGIKLLSLSFQKYSKHRVF